MAAKGVPELVTAQVQTGLLPVHRQPFLDAVDTQPAPRPVQEQRRVRRFRSNRQPGLQSDQSLGRQVDHSLRTVLAVDPQPGQVGQAGLQIQIVQREGMHLTELATRCISLWIMKRQPL